jgi:predicted nuclease of predicted toxin-antitoxin system
MIFWVDAQLPPSLAPWLTEMFGASAQSMRLLGLRDAEDLQIFEAAKQAGDTVIISKDSDFIELIVQRGVPPRLLWVTCGNLTNRRLREVFLKLFPEALRLLTNGESIVEIGDAN